MISTHRFTALTWSVAWEICVYCPWLRFYIPFAVFTDAPDLLKSSIILLPFGMLIFMTGERCRGTNCLSIHHGSVSPVTFGILIMFQCPSLSTIDKKRRFISQVSSNWCPVPHLRPVSSCKENSSHYFDRWGLYYNLSWVHILAFPLVYPWPLVREWVLNPSWSESGNSLTAETDLCWLLSLPPWWLLSYK